MIRILTTLLLAAFLGGCAAPYKTCHSFSECPHSLYSWKPTANDPSALKQADIDGIPYLLEGTPPYYPKDAWDQKIEGELTLQYDVSPDGKPTNIVVVDSQPEGVFDQAGIEALQYSKYTITPEGATGFERRFTWAVEY